MIRHMKIFLKFASLDLSSELRYKANIIIKFLSFIIMDFIGPLVALLIYANTLGIPGWSLNEFLLFQGTMTLVFGLGHAFAFRLAWDAMDLIWEGEFDTIMVKPFKPLTYLALGAFDFPGFAEIMAGLIIIVFSVIKLDIGFTLNYIPYVIFILLGLLLQFGVAILISACAFLFIRTWALFDVWFNMMNFARYPSIIFGTTIRFMITFMFPIAVASYFPSAVLLGRLSFAEYILPMIAVIIFFIFSLFMWQLAMRKYSSAGG